MIDFIQRYPLRYYSRTAGRKTRHRSACFYLRDREKVSLLLEDYDGRLSYTPDLPREPGSPHLFSEADLHGPFSTRFHFPETPGSWFTFVYDGPGCEVRLISAASLDANSVEELLNLPLTAILPTYQQADPLVWEFLNPDGSPLEGDLPETVLFVGIPLRVRDWAEQWCESMEGLLASILPASLAILEWCKAQTDEFILISSTTSSLLAVVHDDRCLLLERLPGINDLLQRVDRNRFEQLSFELDLGDLHLSIYPKEIPMLKAKELVAVLGEGTQVLEYDDAIPSIHCTDGPLPLDAFVLSRQIGDDIQLFVSDKHFQFQEYRLDPIFRSTFHLLLIFAVIQIAVLGTWFHQHRTGEKLSAEHHTFESESARLEGEEEAVGPLIRRIDSVAHWRTALSQRQRISTLLSGIEASTPPDVCLQRITLINRETEPHKADQLALVMTGAAKSQGESALVESLRKQFPAFSIRTESAEGNSFTLDLAQ